MLHPRSGSANSREDLDRRAHIVWRDAGADRRFETVHALVEPVEPFPSFGSENVERPPAVGRVRPTLGQPVSDERRQRPRDARSIDSQRPRQRRCADSVLPRDGEETHRGTRAADIPTFRVKTAINAW